VWDLARATTVRTFSGHAGQVTDAAFSADGRWVVTAGPIRAGVWGLVHGGRPDDRLVFLRGHTRPLTAVAFTPQDRRIVSGSADGTVRTYACRLCGDRRTLEAMAEQRLRALAPRPPG
jgi:WD40 repeat protein